MFSSLVPQVSSVRPLRCSFNQRLASEGLRAGCPYRSVQIKCFIQVSNWTTSMYDNVPVANKKLFWIKGTTRRWDGYTDFEKDSSLMPE